MSSLERGIAQRKYPGICSDSSGRWTGRGGAKMNTTNNQISAYRAVVLLPDARKVLPGSASIRPGRHLPIEAAR